MPHLEKKEEKLFSPDNVFTVEIRIPGDCPRPLGVASELLRQVVQAAFDGVASGEVRAVDGSSVGQFQMVAAPRQVAG